MPDGTFEEVPSDATDEEIEAYLQYRSELSSQRDPSRSGLGSIGREEDEGEEGRERHGAEREARAREAQQAEKVPVPVGTLFLQRLQKW